MTTPEELGFVSPTGDDWANDGDNAIATNALRTAGLYDALKWDATTKANAAKTDAINAAATDATTKANAAKTDAINDATTKYGDLPDKVGEVEIDLAGRPITLIYQLVPFAKTLTIVRGTPIFDTPAKFASAFSGGNTTLSYDGAVPEPEGEFSVECWFHSDAVAASGVVDVIWGMNNAPWLGVEPVTGKAWLSMTGGDDELKSAGSICDGEWHHLAVVMDRAGGKTALVGFWVDGLAVAGTITNGTAAWNSTLTIRGRLTSGYAPVTGARVDELRVSLGNRYPAAFTPQAARFDPDGQTLVLAHLDGLEFFQGVDGYPARPDVANGLVTYVGPVQPSDWETYDVWRKV